MSIRAFVLVALNLIFFVTCNLLSFIQTQHNSELYEKMYFKYRILTYEEFIVSHLFHKKRNIY